LDKAHAFNSLLNRVIAAFNVYACQMHETIKYQLAIDENGRTLLAGYLKLDVVIGQH
jgi:hypothetical protein